MATQVSTNPGNVLVTILSVIFSDNHPRVISQEIH